MVIPNRPDLAFDLFDALGLDPRNGLTAEIINAAADAAEAILGGENPTLIGVPESPTADQMRRAAAYLLATDVAEDGARQPTRAVVEALQRQRWGTALANAGGFVSTWNPTLYDRFDTLLGVPGHDPIPLQPWQRAALTRRGITHDDNGHGNAAQAPIPPPANPQFIFPPPPPPPLALAGQAALPDQQVPAAIQELRRHVESNFLIVGHVGHLQNNNLRHAVQCKLRPNDSLAFYVMDIDMQGNALQPYVAPGGRRQIAAWGRPGFTPAPGLRYWFPPHTDNKYFLLMEMRRHRRP
jgi:hypothetical protein